MPKLKLIQVIDNKYILDVIAYTSWKNPDPNQSDNNG